MGILFNKPAFRKAALIGIRFCLISLLVVFAAPIISVFGQSSKKDARERVFEAESLLSKMGYWLTRVDRTADASTRHALIAFQKVEGRKRTGVLNDEELRALRTSSRPAARFNGEAHIEVDITRQVLFLVDQNGAVTHILPVSTGSEEKYFDEGKWQTAHTPRGAFKITRKINGVRRAPLGALYYPNYFYRGVAIHGSNSIPVRPASHGCVRIPRFADKALSEMVPVGMIVYVFD